MRKVGIIAHVDHGKTSLTAALVSALSKNDLPMISEAEANIRADYRDGKITKEQFQKEMLIMTRSRNQIESD